MLNYNSTTLFPGNTGERGERGPPCDPPRRVAFSIQGGPGFRSDVIQWEHILTNVGDIIITDNHKLGIPTEGAYLLMWSTTNDAHHQVIWLVVNDKMVGTSTTTEISSGNHAILQLRKGDTIWLEIMHVKDRLSTTVTFSGYLIWPGIQ